MIRRRLRAPVVVNRTAAASTAYSRSMADPIPTAAGIPTTSDAARPRGVQHVIRVERTERLSPHLVRVHFAGAGAEGFLAAADPGKLATTDRYVKMLFSRPELGLRPPYDLDALRERLPIEDLPSRRTYTVRSADAETGTLAIDFVVHGDEGIAGPWAANASPGELVAVSGPGGGYAPSADPAIVHVLLGDESAIPAIAAALESLPGDARGTAVIEVGGSDDELALAHPGVDLRWVHRSASGAVHGEALAAAVEAMERPGGQLGVFAHGERAAIKRIRVVLSERWGVDRRSMSLSAYWALGRAEDAFQAEKRSPIGEI